MNNFKVIYKILKYLEEAMDYSEPDYTPIKANILELTGERWTQIIKMLLREGYIEGVEIKQYIRNTDTVTSFNPHITLKGLEYLEENSVMKKVAQAVTGIAQIIK